MPGSGNPNHDAEGRFSSGGSGSHPHDTATMSKSGAVHSDKSAKLTHQINGQPVTKAAYLAAGKAYHGPNWKPHPGQGRIGSKLSSTISKYNAGRSREGFID